MQPLELFAKALRGPDVHRLFVAERMQRRVIREARLRQQLRAQKAVIEQARDKRSAAIHALWTAEDDRRAADGARRQAIACDILRLHAGARLLRLRPRVRARLAWPAAHWVRT